MSIVFKIIAFIWFFISGNNARLQIWGAAEDSQMGLCIAYLIFNWLIALSLYFVGEFIRRIDDAEERFEGIKRKRSKSK